MTTPRRTSRQVARSALVAARREKALELKMQGLTNIAIGHHLAADPAIRPAGTPPIDLATGATLGWPQGYGIEAYTAGEQPPDDYSLSSKVSEDIRRVYQDRAKTRDAVVDEMREETLSRLAAVRDAMFQKALDERDPSVVNAYLKAEESIRKTFGLDRPTKVDLSAKVEARVYTDKDIEALADAIIIGAQPGDPDDQEVGE